MELGENTMPKPKALGMPVPRAQLVENVFLSIFWVLRTLRYQWQNCGQLRKYENGAPGKGLCPFHSRKPFKKGLTLNF